MTPEEVAFLRGFYRAIEDRPLEPDDRFYIPLSEGLGAEVHVALLGRGIEWSGGATAQLFSGFRGTGKTTELLRLRRRLRDAGYIVVLSGAGCRRRW